MRKLHETSVRISTLWDIKDAVHLELDETIFTEKLNNINKNIDLAMKVHGNNLTYFPERQVLSVCISNYFKERTKSILNNKKSLSIKEKQNKDSSKQTGIGLKILGELIQIRIKLAKLKLEENISDRNFNKIYLKETEKMLNNKTFFEENGKEYSHKGRSRFEHFKEHIK